MIVVRKFVHLLDQSDQDFQEELDLMKMREEVITLIRSNQQLENDLNLMDIKIGLLVKNKITLQVGSWPRWPARGRGGRRPSQLAPDMAFSSLTGLLNRREEAHSLTPPPAFLLSPGLSLPGRGGDASHTASGPTHAVSSGRLLPP